MSYPSMDNRQALQFREDLTEEEGLILGKAEREYAASRNIFANFNRASQRLGIPPEKVLLVYALKHMDGIISWSNGGGEGREPVIGRVIDLRNYLLILAQMIAAYENGQIVEDPEATNE